MRTSVTARFSILAASASLLVSGCGDSSGPGATSSVGGGVVTSTPRAVRFIAFGDAGKGTTNQATAAAAMVKLCQVKECQFGLEFGDNFYESGVTSVTDGQFKSKFEDLYKFSNIAAGGAMAPIYPTLGNHDNSQSPQGGEGSSNAKGEFQVQYTTDAANTTKRWKLPARYHNFTYPLSLAAGENPVVEFFCLDSNPLAATVADASTKYLYTTYGPMEQQWLQGKLAASKAKWTIAFAHHPYVSNGSHGNAGSFDGSNANVPGTASGKPWLDLLKNTICDTKYNGGLDVYMFGHDHDYEWLKPVAACNGKTEFILNGSAADPRAFGDAARNPTFFQKDSALSFAWYEITDTALRGEVYVLDANGNYKVDGSGAPLPDFVRTLTKP